MKTNHSILCPALVAGLLWCIPASGPCAVSDQPETWSTNTAGWVNHDLVNETVLNTLVLDSGAVKLTFGSQSMKLPPEEYVFEAGPNASGGSFTGDYVAKGITEIRFNLFCQRPAEVSLLIGNSASARVWRYRIPDIRVGEWMSVSVPISLPALRSLAGAGSLAQFETDLRNVTSVGVAIEREQSLAAQSYWLDNFTLVGQASDFAAWMEQFPKPPDYGQGTCSVLPEGDLDGDGADNYGEWTAGTSAGDAGDRFTLAIDQGVPNPMLRWKAAPGRRYQVWAATDPNAPFVPVGPAQAATVPENSFEDTATSDNLPQFYKVTVEWPAP